MRTTRFTSSTLFFFNDTATTEIYTLSLQRRSSDLATSSIWAIPLALYAAIQIAGPISGGHHNPAVTVAVFVGRRHFD